VARGIAYHSIGPCAELARFHTRLLELAGGGRWRERALAPPGAGA
jgi:hypothetical protein